MPRGPSFRPLPPLIGDENARDRAWAAGSSHNDRLAAPDAPAGNCARETAKIEMRVIDPLDRQTKGRGSAVLLDLNSLQVLEQMRSLIPWRPRASRRHVVA